MAKKLPAPRLGLRRRAEQTKGIGPFAQHRRSADEIAEEAVEPHDAAWRCRSPCGSGSRAPPPSRHRAAARRSRRAAGRDARHKARCSANAAKLGVDRQAHCGALLGREDGGAAHMRLRPSPAWAHPAARAKTSRAGHGRRRSIPETARRQASPRYQTTPARAGCASALACAPAGSGPQCCSVRAPGRSDDSFRRSSATARLKADAEDWQQPGQDGGEANQDDENFQQVREPAVAHIFVDDPEYDGPNDDRNKDMNQDQNRHGPSNPRDLESDDRNQSGRD